MCLMCVNRVTSFTLQTVYMLTCEDIKEGLREMKANLGLWGGGG